VHAYDQIETILGQGTLARELSEQAPSVHTVLVAVGGGGLLGGVASWYGGTGTRVIGVEPVTAPTLTAALQAGRPVDAPAGGIAADSLAPRQVGQLMFPIAQQHVERVVLVEDEDIVRAQQALWDTFLSIGGGAGRRRGVCGDSEREIPALGQRARGRDCLRREHAAVG